MHLLKAEEIHARSFSGNIKSTVLSRYNLLMLAAHAPSTFIERRVVYYIIFQCTIWLFPYLVCHEHAGRGVCLIIAAFHILFCNSNPIFQSFGLFWAIMPEWNLICCRAALQLSSWLVGWRSAGSLLCFCTNGAESH